MPVARTLSCASKSASGSWDVSRADSHSAKATATTHPRRSTPRSSGRFITSARHRERRQRPPAHDSRPPSRSTTAWRRRQWPRRADQERRHRHRKHHHCHRARTVARQQHQRRPRHTVAEERHHIRPSARRAPRVDLAGEPAAAVQLAGCRARHVLGTDRPCRRRGLRFAAGDGGRGAA